METPRIFGVTEFEFTYSIILEGIGPMQAYNHIIWYTSIHILSTPLSEHLRLRTLLETHILPLSPGEVPVEPMTTTDSDSNVEAIDLEDPRLTSRVLLPIDPRRARFPCCVVWTPLPVISWLLPFAGHLGICTEDGVILDFAGSYFVSVDAFTFGATSRYVRLNPEQVLLRLWCRLKSDKTGTKIV